MQVRSLPLVKYARKVAKSVPRHGWAAWRRRLHPKGMPKQIQLRILHKPAWPLCLLASL